jgi:hypothetical protein
MVPIMRDFTQDRPSISFKIDDDVFHCAPALPARVLMNFAVKFDAITEKSTGEDQMAAMMSILEAALKPESYKRFEIRMADSDQPIDLNQVNAVIEWVMGEYGLRPMEPSVSSATGPPDPVTGISSTVNMPGEESTS